VQQRHLGSIGVRHGVRVLCSGGGCGGDGVRFGGGGGGGVLISGDVGCSPAATCLTLWSLWVLRSTVSFPSQKNTHHFLVQEKHATKKSCPALSAARPSEEGAKKRLRTPQARTRRVAHTTTRSPQMCVISSCAHHLPGALLGSGRDAREGHRRA